MYEVEEEKTKHRLKINISRSLNSKPKGYEVGNLSNNIKNEVSLTINQLADTITQPLARVFTPCFFEGDRIKENWISQSIFYLDFDDGINYEDLLVKLESLNLRPNIIYNTLSDTPEMRRLRVVFCLDSPTNDIGTATWIQEVLLKMLPNADKACKTVERMVYPGFSKLLVDNIENDHQEFIRLLHTNMYGIDKRSASNKLREYEYYGDYFSYKGQSSDITKSKSNSNVSKENLSDETYEVVTINANKLKEAIQSIKIMNDFFNINKKVSHKELFGIATNLQYMKGGLILMRKQMGRVNANGGGIRTRDGRTISKYDNSEFGIFPYIRTKNYLPERLESFSPYQEDYDYHNIISELRAKRDSVLVLESMNRMTLKEAEKQMRDKFNNVINENANLSMFEEDFTMNYDHKVTLIKCFTGLGKTELLTKVQNTLMAFPTNKLKNEVAKRMQVDCVVTPDYPTFEDDDINIYLSNLSSANQYDRASKILEKIANYDNTPIKYYNSKYEPSKLDVSLALFYKMQNQEAMMSDKTVLTTHARAMNDPNFKHKLLIFDEDLVEKLIVSGVCLIGLSQYYHTDFGDTFKEIDDYFRLMPCEVMVKTPSFVIKKKSLFIDYCVMNNIVSILKLLESDTVFKETTLQGEIKYKKNMSMPAKNILILSATAVINIYNKLVKNFDVLDISNVIKVGSVSQHIGKSWSKQSMSKAFKNPNDTTISTLKALIGDREVITHMSFKKKFKNKQGYMSAMHFGNTSGYDTLKGQDIAVVGTPNLPTWIYFFYADFLGIELTDADKVLAYRTVTWNGFKFSAMTFANEELRNIQFSLIESEVVQAVGRNRNLRENCHVMVFCSIPLRISDEFIDKKNKVIKNV